MNRTDILKALISRSISPEEVRSALDDAQNFLGTVNALEAIDGVKITVDVNAQVFPANEWDVAKALADSCWALEMLYTGKSNRSHWNYAS